MQLIERDFFMESLRTRFGQVSRGEGHCVFISGEAGIGKTSLVKTFCKEREREAAVYQGSCDALFTPRPLAPLYDIVWQIRSDLWEDREDRGNARNAGDPEDLTGSAAGADRAGLFSRLFHELENQPKPILIIFEDIHWADEATLDFVKFLARRITRLRCLFLLTYRDHEIHADHPLRNVLGQLSPDSFTRLQLTPLSRQAVDELAMGRGYRGDDVYEISGGNPFYVNEILASYSPGIPDNIKDAILSVSKRQDEKTRQVWELLSVLPTGMETRYLEKMEPEYASAVEQSLASGILVLKEGSIFFKHELYRRTIESSLSPAIRVSLNKRILELFLGSFERRGETERIIHHAKHAHDYALVVRYAPLAARKAASVGAHIEASRLYLSAIEYYEGTDAAELIGLYESYAYECYLTSQVKEAILYQGKALALWKEKGATGKMEDSERKGEGTENKERMEAKESTEVQEKTGDCLRFLSRLWWFNGNRQQAESFGEEAIGFLKDLPSSKAKAMAMSNMSQLKMLSDHFAESIAWGERAISMATELGDVEILCHALNNVGTSKMSQRVTREEGSGLLQESLAIALRHSFHEHAARAYTNLSSKALEMKDYPLAEETQDAGIRYCEERDLDSWRTYMLSWKARLKLERGYWNEANTIANTLLEKDKPAAIVAISALAVAATIRIRRGEPDALAFLEKARVMAFEAREPQRITPVLAALLEYEWITDSVVVEKEAIDLAVGLMGRSHNIFENSRLAFWLWKVRKIELPLREWYEGYQVREEGMARRAAAVWEKCGCSYEQALMLFEGDEADKKKALSLIAELDAASVYQRMQAEMRMLGIKGIPRGIRKATRSNAALLTGRELEVLSMLQEGLQNKEIAARLYISAKTVDHHISSILFKLDANTRVKAVQQAIRMGILS